MGVDSLTRAVFLDRDGVINQALIRDGRPFSPTNMDEFSWVDGIKEAARELKRAGYKLFCATNQPDVGRGLQKRQVVESFHSTILKGLPLEKIYVCYHDDRDGCACRKPRPGMLLEASREYGLNLGESWLVGDRWKDIDAGYAAGCRTVFLDYNYDECLNSPPDHTIRCIEQLSPLIIDETE